VLYLAEVIELADYPIDNDVVVPKPPASVLSFTFTGAQVKPSLPEVNGKKPTSGPPFFISNQSPALGIKSDIEWTRNYSASLDTGFALINGIKLQQSENEMRLGGIYKDGSFTISDNNIWKLLPGDIQQIHYLASKDKLNAASEATEKYGDISEVRGIGFRIPSIAGGWGRTIDGLPTDPNPQDPRKNDDEHKLARETWKNGPIEFRWDYRKGSWTAYNELIEDHYDSELGTWVFGTNNDTDKGYPFLRGKLEDVFWVRQPKDLAGTDGTKEGIKTGQLMIHLDTKLFDESENGAAKLSSVFIVPHTNATDDTFHVKGDENTLGNEITGSSDNLDIRTDAHFHKEKGLDGPIFFYKKASELDVCCKPSNNKFFAGKMIFMDADQDVCAGTLGGNTIGIAVNTPDAGERGKWVPAVQIDECELVGAHFLKLVNNDIQIATSLANTCTSITTFTSSFATAAAANFDEVKDAIDCLNTEIAELAAYTDAGILSLGNNIAKLEINLTLRMEKIIHMLVQQINAALAACDCPLGVLEPRLQGQAGIPAPPSTYVVDPCPVVFSPLPSLDCATACSEIQLEAPCCQPDSVTIPACGGGAPGSTNTQYGNCQSHED